MNKTIVDIVLYLFETLFVFYYAQSLFKQKYKYYIPLLVAFVEHIVLLVIYQTNITYLNAILVFIFNIILFKGLYDISLKAAAFHAAIIVAVMLTSEILTMSISSIIYNDFNALENDINAYLFVVSTSKTIYFTIMIIIAKLFSIHHNKKESDKYYWLLFSIPFSSTLNFIVFRYITYQIKLTPLMSKLWIFSCSLTLIANVLVFIIYEMSIKNTIELYELKAMGTKQKQDSQYYEVMEQTLNDMKIFSHNMKNHLTQIKNLEDMNEVSNYIDGLYHDIENFSPIGLSQNKMLDLILSKYQKLCRKKNITFDIDVKTSNLSFIDDFDLSTLLNNLLDNAVEAAEMSDKKRISFTAFESGKRLNGIIIKNSCDHAPNVENGKLKTNKGSQELHGIGMMSINRIIKKYHGISDWKYNKLEHYFQISIAFMKN